MGLKWKEIGEEKIEITRNKRRGIKLVIKKYDDCLDCALTTSSNLCRKFNICYWITSHNRPVSFDRVYKRRER